MVYIIYICIHDYTCYIIIYDHINVHCISLNSSNFMAIPWYPLYVDIILMKIQWSLFHSHETSNNHPMGYHIPDGSEPSPAVFLELRFAKQQDEQADGLNIFDIFLP